MSRRSFVLACLLLTGLLTLTGCPQSVNVEKTVTLEPGDIKQPAIIDAPRSQQKIRVDVNSGEPIDVDVALESEAADIVKNLGAGKRPEAAKVLASKQGVKTEAVEATIPAGKSYTVILSGAKKKTEVKVKVHSL
jgi:hypothetical protein